MVKPDTCSSCERYYPKFYSLLNVFPGGDSIEAHFPMRHYRDGRRIRFQPRVEFYIDGTLFASADSLWLPLFISEQAIGRHGKIVLLYRATPDTPFTAWDSVEHPIAPAALLPDLPNATVRAGGSLNVRLMQGVHRRVPVAKGVQITVTDDQGSKFCHTIITAPGDTSLVPIPIRRAAIKAPVAILLQLESDLFRQCPDEEIIQVLPPEKEPVSRR